MIFELVGSRVLAPFFGTALPVWTSLIGVILGSLSAGYYLGGKLADKNSQYRILSLLQLLSAGLIAFTALIKTFVLSSIFVYFSDIRLGSVSASFILFAPTSFFLGMITPYAIKLRLSNIETSGKTIGALYAISTLGSILGTFAAGFYLVPIFGSTKILYLLAVLLCFSAFILEPKQIFKLKKRHSALLLILTLTLAAILIKTPLTKFSFASIDTAYNSLHIYETKDPKTQRPVRCLSTDPQGTQGAMFLDDDNDLVFDYLKYYRLAEHFSPVIRQGLFIGGGVYAFPKDFLKRNQEAMLDVVELDPGVTAAAKKYFNLQDNERMKIIHEDGRTYLNRNEKKYDVIYVDAFNAHISIPFQLTTKEAIEKMYDSLNEDGVVLTNIISAVDGDKGKFLRAEIATYKEYFQQVYIFLINPDRPSTEYGNIMLVAIKSKNMPSFASNNQELSKYLSTLWKNEISFDMPILTDDYAPIDYYTSAFIK